MIRTLPLLLVAALAPALARAHGGDELAAPPAAPAAAAPAAGTPAAAPAPDEKWAREPSREKSSYALGVELGRSVRREGVPVDSDAVLRGVRDVLSGNALELSDVDVKKYAAALRHEARRTRSAAFAAVTTNRKKESDAFLAANRANKGVRTLESGVQYEVLRAGEGAKPAADARVQLRYRGTLPDGTEFDRSPGDGPVTLELAKLLPGLREALARMPAGSRWRVVVPPELAYGPNPYGRHIGPNSTLVFDVELVAIAER